MKIGFGNKTDRIDSTLADNSVRLRNSRDLDKLMEQIGEARYVLLGEASHGTHDYNTWRTEISKRLIGEKGFSFIAVEGDWPDCYRVNRYVKNYPDAGKNALEVLHAFNRWPTWMWANWEVVALAEWLKDRNKPLPANKKAGFYGLDVYSLWESMETIIGYLEKKDPKTKEYAMEAFRCFEPFSDGEGQAYARATMMVPSICEDEVVNLLAEVRKNMPGYNTDPEAVMSAERNAQVIVNAERYYRAMIHPGPESWNIRDRHMTDTLFRLMEHYGPESKGIVWEHNTHIGDARATDMKYEGLVNVGQLVREKLKHGTYTIGFGSYSGSVIAGEKWGAVMREMIVPPARKGSWEHHLHNMSEDNRILFMNEQVKKVFGDLEYGHRAIGVVYHPEYEHYGNYVPSRIPERYDAFIYLDQTSALHPLHIRPDGGKMPETYPFGF